MAVKSSHLMLAFFLSTSSAISLAKDIDKIELPDLGDSSSALISPVQEQELGKAFYRNLHSQINISHDPEIEQYIQSIGKKLVTNSDQPGNPFHFFVVIDSQINAFAGPGGYIGVNSGLILLTEAESELASVMAHEVAHVTQRHLYRAFEAASKLSLPTAAATLAAILLGTQSPELAQAALVAIQAGSTQFQIDFTRDNEKEADRVGMQTLSKSEFDPRSMPNFFERLQQSTRYYGREVPEFLRTHPVSSSRISDTRGRADKYQYKQYPDSISYLLTKAKLRVMTAKKVEQAYKYFSSKEKQGTKQQQAVTQYGLGLVNLEQREYKKAETIFQTLYKQYPNQPQYIYALAKTANESQQYQQALQLLEKAHQKFTTNFAIKIDYILTLLKTNQAAKAKNILQTFDPTSKQLPIYFELMAQTHAELDQQAESQRYLAEFYYSIGQTEAAILHIKLAKKAKDINFYLQAIVDERLAFFENEERERKLNR